MVLRHGFIFAAIALFAAAGFEGAASAGDRATAAAAGITPPPKITYQGRLERGGTALTATADFQYTLWDAEAGGTQLGSVGIGGVSVDRGIFTSKLDFGAEAFTGEELWLEISVCDPAGSCTLEPLSPRQEITASPHSVRALKGAGPQGAVEVSADTGNVGIGVAEPAAKLEVDGDVKSSGTMTSSTALIVDTTAQLATAKNGDLVLSHAAVAGLGPYVQLVGDGSSDVDIAICNRPGMGCHHIFDDASDGNALKLESATELAINIQSPANEVMRITGSGVGIGTTTPTEELHVDGNLRLSGAFPRILTGSDAQRFSIYGNSSSGDSRTWIELFGNEPGRVGELALAGTYVDLRYGSTDSDPGETGVRLTSTGTVGIGTNDPGNARLNVETDSDFHAIEGHNTNTSFGYVGVLGVSDSVLGHAVSGFATANSGANKAVSGLTNSPDGYGAYFSGVAGSRNYFERSVGIGTDDPAGLLHVATDTNPLITFENNGDTTSGRGVSLHFDHSNGTGAQIRGHRGSGDADGMFLAFHTQAVGGSVDEHMRIATDGCVGLGGPPNCDVGTNVKTRLHVIPHPNDPDGSEYAAWFDAYTRTNSAGLPAAFFNRTGNDGSVVSIMQNGAVEGSISVSGTTVSYNAFTGSHYGWVDQPMERGTLVTMTGDNRVYHDREQGEVIYGVARSTAANDSRCLGAYLGLEESNQPESSSNPHQIMAVGNGDMWVVDTGKSIQPGDNLISSDVAGHAMLDDPNRFPIGYVVARAGEPVDWSTVDQTTTNGRKRKKISVFFESFERGNSVVMGIIVERQQQEVDELRSRVESLEGGSSVNPIRAGLPLVLVGLLALAALRRRTAARDA